jgi:hypothetical protein
MAYNSSTLDWTVTSRNATGTVLARTPEGRAGRLRGGRVNRSGRRRSSTASTAYVVGRASQREAGTRFVTRSRRTRSR